MGFANINDFKLQKTGNVSPQAILDNSNISLYSLDFQSKNGIFVETKSGVNLSNAPFLYNAQYDNAVRVYAAPFGQMVQMARSIPVAPEKLIFIHTVGRAGSTLASRLCSKAGGAVSISEPEALTWLVAAKLANPHVEKELVTLFDACVRFLCKANTHESCVIKGRSFVIELAGWIHEKYPQSKNVFLYRDAISWLKSGLKAYVFDLPDVDMKVQEKNLVNNLLPLVPLIAEYSKQRHLRITETIALMWLSGMERYMQLHESGFDMLAIRFESWQESPRETALAMLDYCGLNISDEVLNEVLHHDSQEGTHLSRETLSKKERELTEEDINLLNNLLQEHPLVQKPDFEVPNTLKCGD